MASRTTLSKALGIDGLSLPTVADVQALITQALSGIGGSTGGSSKVTARQLINPKYGKGVHPAANVNGPIVTNAATTNVKPDTTNMRWVPWNEMDEAGRAVFNRQGLNWEAAAAPFQVAATATAGAAVNASQAYGGAGYIGASQTLGAQQLHFLSQTSKVIVQFQAYGAYVNSSDFDITMMVEDNGKMSRVQATPERIAASSSTDTLYKTLTTAGSRTSREHRYFMPGNTLIHGIWIDKTADMRAGPMQPLWMCDGDSWIEGLNLGKAALGVGADPVYGTYATATIGRWIEIITGWKLAPVGRGGTGFDATNSGNDTTFLSVARNTWAASKFAAQKAVGYLMLGGGNDGYHNGPVGTPFATYRDNILSRVADMRAKFNDPTMPVVLNGPQSLSDPLTQFPNGPQAVHRAACIAAAATAGSNIQFFDQIDYTDGNFGDTTGAAATTSWGRFTADVLHGCISGQEWVGELYVDDICPLTFDQSRVNDCLAVKM